MRRRFVLLVCSIVSVFASCSESAAYCQRSVECSEDTGDDSDEGADDVAVCSAQTDGLLRALRANAEPECTALANAISALNACRAQLSCDDFDATENNGECQDERDGVGDACDDIRDAEVDCESLFLLQCAFGS